MTTLYPTVLNTHPDFKLQHAATFFIAVFHLSENNPDNVSLPGKIPGCVQKESYYSRSTQYGKCSASSVLEVRSAFSMACAMTSAASVPAMFTSASMVFPHEET